MAGKGALQIVMSSRKSKRRVVLRSSSVLSEIRNARSRAKPAVFWPWESEYESRQFGLEKEAKERISKGVKIG